MAGKYAGITSKLPKYENPDVSYAQKTRDRKAELLVSDNGLQPDETDKAVNEKLEQALQLLTEANHLIIGYLKGSQSPALVGRAYKTIRIMKDRMAEQEYDVNLTIAAFEQLLPEIYEREDMTNVHMANGGSVGVQWEPYAKVVDRDAHREWCIKEGLIRSMTIPWQTTNALTKERLISGLPAPDGVEASAKPKVVLRKA